MWKQRKEMLWGLLKHGSLKTLPDEGWNPLALYCK